jgi:hypothetical protein
MESNNKNEDKTTFTFRELSNCKYGDKIFDNVKFIANGDIFLGELYSCESDKRIIFMDDTAQKLVEVVNLSGKINVYKFVIDKYMYIEIPDNLEVYKPIQY